MRLPRLLQLVRQYRHDGPHRHRQSHSRKQWEWQRAENDHRRLQAL